jgi:hypothetical protein
MNKHNHFTTSYYLLLKRYNENNGKLNLELNESNMDKIGRKTAYPGKNSTSVRGNSVKSKDQNKIDPFSHLTPVARRFLENNELVNKGYMSKNSKRMNSTGADYKRKGAESPKNIIKQNDDSYSPQRSNLMAPFRNKGGYSAPEQKKRYVGYADISQGSVFNSRIATAIKSVEKKNSPYSIRPKAQLPNVSKQRVQIKPNSDRPNNRANPNYPNANIGQNVSRSSNNSSKRRDIQKYPNTSFQVTNNFIQTSYGAMGSLNNTQMNNTGYGGLMYDSKLAPAQTSTSRANSKKYRINNFYSDANSVSNNMMYLRKHNKNLFSIYKSKVNGKDDKRGRSPNSPRNKSNNPNVSVPTTQLFVKQYPHHAARSPSK